MLKLTGDTREAVEELHARDAARDAMLCDDLNSMAAQLEKGHDFLAQKGDTLQVNLDAAVARMSQAPGSGQSGPDAPPGLVSQQLEYLQTAVGGLVARLQSGEPKAET